VGRAFGDARLLATVGSVTTVLTVSLLVLAPNQLPSWVPGIPRSTADSLVVARSLDDAAQPFTVTPGDGQLTVTWPPGTAWNRYRAEAVDERFTMPAAACRPVDRGPAVAPTCVLTGLTDGSAYLVSMLAADPEQTVVPTRTVRATPRPDLLASNSVVLWLDPSDLSTVRADRPGPATLGSRVMQVRDKSSHHADATQPDNGFEPTVGQLGPLPALLLNGAQVLGVSASGLPLGDAPSTVVAVAAQDDTSPDRSTCFHNLLAWGAGRTAQARIIEKGCYTSMALAETFGTSGNQPATQAWPTGKAVVLSAVFDAAGTSVRMDATTSYRWSAPANLKMNTVNDSGMTLGGVVWDPHGGWDGRIGDVVIFDRVLTSKELLSVEKYLAAKWELLL
jgi:hypothetical protein